MLREAQILPFILYSPVEYVKFGNLANDLFFLITTLYQTFLAYHVHAYSTAIIATDKTREVGPSKRRQKSSTQRSS